MESQGSDKTTPQDTTFIAGGGVSGLLAAYKLMKLGKHVVIGEEQDEKNSKFGKVETGTLDGEAINFGAEFIDTNHKELMALAKELHVPLVKAADQQSGAFQKPDGSIISEEELLTAFRPVSEKIERDKKIMASDLNGALAKKIDSMSMGDYLNSLNKEAEAEHPLSFFRKIINWFTRKKNPNVVPQDILQTIAGAYSAESGNDNPSARQFAAEANSDLTAETGSLLNSDAGWRVEGGTAALYEALKTKLKEGGVEFRYNTKLTSIAKNGNKFQAGFENGSSGEFDHVVMAMPMHELAKVQGLDALGFSSANHEILEKGQYTHSTKVFIKFKPDFAKNHPDIAKQIANECYLSSDGVQAWPASPDIMEFLVGGENANSRKGKKLIDHLMERYVEGLNKRLKLTGGDRINADDLFDKDKTALRGPMKCYASPSPGQVGQFLALSDDLDKLAQQGVGVCGTWIPSRGEEAGSIGFMNCGAESADRAVAIMTGMSQARSQAMEAAMQPQPSFVERFAPAPAKNERGWGLA